jgi:hypothetical protein
MLHCLLGSDCRATPLVKRAAGCSENSCAKVRPEGLAFLPLEHISDFLAICNDEHTMVLCAVQLLPLVSWQGGSKHTCIACNSGAFQHWSTASQQQAQVVVTREAGKNGKLKSALQKQGISVLELPLVETGPGPDRYKTLHAWSADCSTLQTQSTKVAH